MAYLCSQAHGVEHNQEEHEVLKVAGGDDVPDLVLVRVLGNVASQRARLQRVLHTLALEEGEPGVHHHVFRSGSLDVSGQQCIVTFIAFQPGTFIM